MRAFYLRLAVLCSVLFLSACGAVNIQEAMTGAKSVSSVSVAMDYQSAFQKALVSEYATSPYAKSALFPKDNKAYIWFGGERSVYAVIEFTRIDLETTKVTFYEYGGLWHNRLEGIRNLLTTSSMCYEDCLNAQHSFGFCKQACYPE